jgi:hypothetical protein
MSLNDPETLIVGLRTSQKMLTPSPTQLRSSFDIVIFDGDLTGALLAARLGADACCRCARSQ